jgi:hypothetical protein
MQKKTNEEEEEEEEEEEADGMNTWEFGLMCGSCL